MKPLLTKIALYLYRRRLEKQKMALQQSAVFNCEEKRQLQNVFGQLESIIDNNLAKNITVNQPNQV